MNDSQLKEARLAALKLLTVRALTSAELRKRLKGKDFSEGEIDVVISEFAAKRLLDDSGIADDVIEYSLERRLEGKRQARNRLMKRGVAPEDISEKLDEAYTLEKEFAAALEFATKKQRSVSSYPLDVQRRRIAGALERRGFPSNVIGKVLSVLSFSETESFSEDDEDN